MKPAIKVLVVTLAVAAAATGVALAAASPTVITGGAIGVTGTTAVLQARVNPSSSSTSYQFNYGLTAAYTASTALKAIGKGSVGLNVSTEVTGLTPGTAYHYRVSAENAGGTAYGLDRTFTTAGHPPPGVETGGATNVLQTSATVTASINPNGEAAQWAIQYGTTTSYGSQTVPSQPIAAFTTPQPVAIGLSGLAPATLFHYRVVAYHADQIVEMGADATFFTEPVNRRPPALTATVSPRTDAHRPFSFTVKGTLRGAPTFPVAQRCTGNVGIRFYNGKRQLAFVVAPVQANCTFGQIATFRRTHATGAVAVRVRVDYRGNGYLAPGTTVKHVTAG